MSNDNKAGDDIAGRDHESGQGDTVARLLNLAGLRPLIAADIEARVYDHVHQEWRNSLPASRTGKWAMPLALAAGILIAVTFVTRLVLPDAPLVGTVARVNGGFDGSAASFVSGDAVRVGDNLRTGDRQLLSVALSDGTSLRLAANSSLQLDERRSYTLLTGKVYADSGQTVYQDSGLEIRTGLGVITDIGTQFLVSFEGAALSVAVREGRVDVAADQDTYTALAGDRLMMQAGGGVTKGQIGATDSAWDWTLKLAPEFDIENRSLLDFLTWVSRETGKELIFVNDELRKAAMATVLSGSISDLTPVEAATTVLTTTSFAYEIRETSIIIGR